MKNLIMALMCLFAVTFTVSATPDIKREDVEKGVKSLVKIFGGGGKPSQNSSESQPIYKERDSSGDKRLRAKCTYEWIKVKVISCEVDEDDNAYVVFSIENLNSRDYNFGLEGVNSQAFDDEKNRYSGEKFMKFAESRDPVFYKNLEGTAPSGITQKFRLLIADVDPAARAFTKIDIKIVIYGTGSGVITFSNVPIKRPGDE